MRKFVTVAVCVAIASTWLGASAVGAASNRAHLAGSHARWATASSRVGDVAPTGDISVRVYLNGRDDAGLEAVARSVSDPASASYHRFLSAADVRARFAPAPATIDAVSAWLAGNGLRLGDRPANDAYVAASGSPAKIASTFGVKLATYRVRGMNLRGTDTDLSMPASIAPLVSGVIGVDQTESLMRPDHIAADPSVAPPAGFNNAPPCSESWAQKVDTTDPAYGGGFPAHLPYAPCGYKPGQLRSAYGLSSTVDGGHTGASATVAIVDAFASPTIFQDASTYAQRNDPSHPLRKSQFSQVIFTPNKKLEGPNQCDASGWFGEETLDVEAVHAMAPGAHIVYVGGGDCNDSSLDIALNAVVADHLASIVSNSYGDQGEGVPASTVKEFERIAIQAAAEGIGVYFSSGDDGDEVATLGSAAPDFSASSPWVTAVGGTSLGVGANGSTVFQTAWETGKSTLAAGAYTPAAPGAFLYGSGGGTSTLFAEPDYQKGVVPNALAHANGAAAGRVVPDVAMDGDPNTGFLIGETQKFPARAGGVRYGEYRIGGTSLSSPLLAGVVALADDLAGSPHGFINPALYSKVRSHNGLVDVTHAQGADVRVDYVNGVDAKDGTTTTVRTFDFPGLAISTTPGYDTTTGLGVPNGSTFLQRL